MGPLINRIAKKEAVIGIYGLGYVGLPLVLRFAEEGFKIIGFDIDKDKVESLNNGKSYIEHIASERVAKARDGRFEATTDFTRGAEVDALILCVPTPLNKFREPDMTYVIATLDSITPYLRKGQLISLESTTYPGTTEEEIVPRANSRGLKVGEDIHIVFSPEREDPGRADFSTKTTPKVVGGITSNCLEAGCALYKAIVDRVVPVSSTRVAEMSKLLENIHRAVNIGLVNELKIVCEKMDIDIHEVIDAAATKPFGFVAYRPGPGLGGHCIPIDPFYLTWKAREYGVHTRFIELAGQINSSMPSYVLRKVAAGLNDHSKCLKDASILVLGLAYKKNIDDVRESPAVELMEKLRAEGALVQYHDPHVPTFPKMRGHQFDLSSIELTPEHLNSFDCVVLVTDHDDFDYDMILKESELLVDTRGRYRKPSPNMIRA